MASYLNNAANAGRTCICVGTGNEGNRAGHISGIVEKKKETVVEMATGTFVPSMNLQIWKNYQDQMDIYLIHPFGKRIGPLEQVAGARRFLVENTELLVYYGQPAPYTMAQEIFIDFLPKEDYIDSGVWKIVLIPKRIIQGDFDMWLPGGKTLGKDTGFYRAVPETTLTIPSTARQVISVGAYNQQLQSYADFSGRGYTRGTEQIKPDLVAPGVNITTVRAGGGYGTFTGTSFAVPFVTGATALLMEWGIVRGNDMYLYGEKVKSYLISGARKLPGEQEYPNPKVGYGALCVADSLPV